MAFDQAWIVERLTILIPLWLSLSFHECAHAWAAWKLGDDTAAMLGRLTLNPLAHIDPVGTLLLPLLGVPFGWAKPVPVQPIRFTHKVTMRTGMMITAAAGPLSNLILAAVTIVLFVLLARFDVFQMVPVKAAQALTSLLVMMIFLNVILALFNLLPIPPLDGSRIADRLMPRTLQPAWENFSKLGPIALAAVIILPMLSGFSLFEWPMTIVGHFIGWLIAL